MYRSKWLAGFVLAMCCVPAWAERNEGSSVRPFLVVRRCVERLEGLGERSVQIIGHQTMRAVRLIDHLQENGLAAEAEVAAERSTAFVNELGNNAQALVDRALENCLMILARIEAPQAGIDMVTEAAAAAKEAITSANDRAVMEIQNALET